jgi:hypothetical protein
MGDSASVQAVTRVNAEQALYGAYARGAGIDVDAPGEIVAVSEQDGGPQRGVMVVLVIRPGEPGICFGIDSVVDVGPIDADPHVAPQ